MFRVHGFSSLGCGGAYDRFDRSTSRTIAVSVRVWGWGGGQGPLKVINIGALISRIGFLGPIIL